LRAEIAELRGFVGSELARLNASFERRLADQRAEQMRWVFGLWATQVLTLLGTVLLVLRSG
jgi:hypothetical protein